MSEAVDFRMIVDKIEGESRFVAVVADAPVPRWGRQCAVLDLKLEELERRLADTSSRWKRASGGDSPGDAEFSATAKEGELRRIGIELFNTLFPVGSRSYQLYAETCQYAKLVAHPAHVRLRLEIHGDLSRFPWELMRPELKGPLDQHVAAVARSTIRYLGNIANRSSAEPESQGKRSCVLIVPADPSDMRTPPRVAESFNRERDALRRLLDSMGIKNEVITKPTLASLENRIKVLERGGYTVEGLHFIGHGYHSKRGSYFCGEDGQGACHEIYGEELINAISEANALQWVVFNACWTALEPVDCPLTGLATSISLFKEVPIVIAYNREVETDEAEKLALEFHTAVLQQRRAIGITLQSIQTRFNNPGGMVVLARSVAGSIPDQFRAMRLDDTPKSASEGAAASPRSTSAKAPHERSANQPTPRAERPVERPSGAVRVPPGILRRGLTNAQIQRLIQHYESRGLPSGDDVAHALRAETEKQVPIAEFWMDSTLVTQGQFEEFVLATGHETLAERRGAPETWRTPSGGADHPVVFVCCADAEAYCRWRGARLPTADEWKWAYRGPDARVYPWGDQFSVSRCNTAESEHWGTTPVTRFPEGRSAAGCYDLLGNVEEFTSSLTPEGRVTILGGSWCMSCEFYGLPVLHRLSSKEFFSNEQGFRCAYDSNGR
jgi:formylglycine-generating enzyme required for sulfatase activity